jgi:hypothetical protein
MVENWYTTAVDSASAGYRMATQVRVLFVAMAIAVAFNINTLTLTEHFLSEPVRQARVGALVDLAGSQSHEGDLSNSVAMRLASAGEQFRLPIGWSGRPYFALRELLFQFPGWLVTALVASMTAPLCFAAFGTLASLRNRFLNPKYSERNE